MFKLLLRMPYFDVILIYWPCNKLHKCGAEGNASLCIENGAVGITDEVSGHHLILRVTQNTLHRTLRSSLHGRLDLIHGGFLRQTASKVDYRYVRCRDTEGHTSQFAEILHQGILHNWLNLTSCVYLSVKLMDFAKFPQEYNDLPIEIGDNFSDSLCSSCWSRNDVLWSCTSITPGLQTNQWNIKFYTVPTSKK